MARPLITERSLLSWAEKLAVEEGETFPDVLRAIGCAVIDGELPIMWIGPARHEQPIGLPEHLTTVLPIINQWEVFEFSYPRIVEQIGSIMIKTTDMASWLRGRGAATDDECDHPAPRSPTKQKPGPKSGRVDRFKAADEALYPEIEKLMEAKSISVQRAAFELAEDGRVKGYGTPASRARRLADRYRST
jgi:hypothetical protein